MPLHPSDLSYFDPEPLTTGESTIPRSDISAGNIAMTSQLLRLAYFTATKTETITQVRILTGAVAAGATPSLIRVGIWSTDATGALIATLATTANDTTLLAPTTNLGYTKALQASFAKVRGTRYAMGLLVVTAATAPQTLGKGGNLPASEALQSPVVSAQVSGQADLPSSLVAGSLTGTGNRIYMVLLP